MGVRRTGVSRPVTEIDVAGNAIRLGVRGIVVENQGEPGKRAQALAAGAGREVHAAEIDRDRAQRTDAVDADAESVVGGDLFELLERVEDAGGRLVVHAPDPPPAGHAGGESPDLFQVEHVAPAQLQPVERQAGPARLGRNPLAELAVGQHQARAKGDLHRV